jgi:hypothetical protein
VLPGRSGIVEAALQLGWKQGTLAGRLARARELLRRRFDRRGLTLSATSERWAAAVPGPLEESALRAALVLLAGQSAAGGTSLPVAALVAAVLRDLYLATPDLTRGSRQRQSCVGWAAVQRGRFARL